MATKLQLISELAAQSTQQMTSSVENWKGYLNTASRLYKYGFDDQLLIHAQRPDATACATMELWNGTMHRWVRPGAKGIALIHKGAGRPRLEYVFDVADTREVRGAKQPWLWAMTDELQAPVLAAFERRYGEFAEGDFGDRLMELTARAVGESYREYLHDLSYDLEDSFLEGLDDLNLEVRFRNAMTASVQYMMLTRCGVDPSNYLEDEDLQGITEFTTPAVLAHLGNAVSNLSGELLQEIGSVIRTHQRDILQNPLAKQDAIRYTRDTDNFTTLKRERSNKNGIDLSEERRLSDSQLGDRRDGGQRAVLGQIRDAAPDLLAGEAERNVHLDAADGQAVGAPTGDRPDSTDTGRPDPIKADEAAQRGREVESVRPDEMGAGSEQFEADGRGNDTDGADLQLTANELHSEVKSDSQVLSDFVATAPDDLLFELLRHDQHFKAKRVTIADYFDNHPDHADRATYMRKLRDDAFTEFDVGITRVGYRATDEGLHVWTGKYLSRTSESMLSWDLVQALTADMMERGEFLSAEDKPLPAPKAEQTVAAYQLSLFPTVEGQIENIVQAQAEEQSSAFSFTPRAAVSQEVIDRVLTAGSNEWHSIERIVANFQIERTGSAHVSFLQKEYGEGGKGFRIDGCDYAVWFDKDSLRIAPGRTVNSSRSITIPWVDVAVRIGQLLQEGQFATQERIDAARDNECKELAASLWYLRQDFADEAREQGFMPTISELYGGFPDSTAKIALLLEDAAQRSTILSELKEFAEAHQNEPKLMRFRFYNPKAIFERLSDLGQTPTQFTAAADFKAERPNFVTQDEIDTMLAGDGYSEIKMQIYSYFVQGHDLKERVAFLKGEYGTGGGGHLGYNESHDSKGISLRRDDEFSDHKGYDTVRLNWNHVDKRIGELIKAKRFLSAMGMERIPEYEALIVARQVYAFYRYAPTDEPKGYSWDWDSDAAKRDYVPKLQDPVQAEALLADMQNILATAAIESRYLEMMQSATTAVESYVNGTYSLFTPLPPEQLQAERDKKEAARAQKKTELTDDDDELDDLAAAARALSRKKPSKVKENKNGQMSLDFAAPSDTSLDTPVESGDLDVNRQLTAVTEEIADVQEEQAEQSAPEPPAPEPTQAQEVQAKQKRELPALHADAYLNLKAEHPDKIIGIHVDGMTIYYGTDAETAAHALGKKIVTREVEGLGETSITGTAHGWQADLVKLLDKGNSVLFVGEDGMGGYETIKARTAAEYIPIGMELTMDGRRMQIDSVDFTAGTVSLRDLDIPNYPIFRSESIPFVRSFIEEQQLAVENMQQTFEDVVLREQPPEPVEIEGGKLIDIVIDLRPREVEKTANHSYDEINKTLKNQMQSVEQHPNYFMLYEDFRTWAEFRNGDNLVGHTVVEWIQSICEMSTNELNRYLDAYTPGLLDAHRLLNSIPEHKNTPTPNRHNFRITDDDLGAGGQKTKYQFNVEAIRTLKQIETENRLATPAEQEILSRYVGWGGIADAFDEGKEKWTKEYAELKELLTPAEYDSARGSVLNAHYTSPTVIKAMYEAVEQMGLNPGNVLEPAMGVGNFFGLTPKSMENTKLYGVELDSLTGRIAKQLYQKADITVAGFEKTDRRDFYDLMVGNVPFGQYKVSDKPYDKLNFPIHDYFLTKGIDQLRPGGVMAVVTSHYTMDKQNTAARAYLAKRADLLGAIRLPNNAFKQNAGTEVTTDILFFQKRDRAPEREPEWVQLGQLSEDIPVNRYFVDNPHMILGDMVTQSGQFGTEITCQPKEGENLSAQLATAIGNLIPPDAELLNADPTPEADSPAQRESIPADPSVRNFSYTMVEGEIYYRENSRMKPMDMGKTPTERVKGMLSIRDSARRLIDLQLEGAPESEIQREQAKLNVLYDQFAKKHGLINSLGNKQAFESDSSYPLLCSLEIIDEDGNLERKADMFSKRTIHRHSPVTSVDTAVEALGVSIGEKACIDLGFMASLMGGNDKLDSMIKDLKGVIFKDPLSDRNDPYAGWQPADEYLSGNVREKLAVARTAAETRPEYAINVEKLEQVQPKELTTAEIDVRIGATWIDPKYYAQFMFELLQTPVNLRNKNVDIHYSPISGEWNVMGKRLDSSNNARANATYGTMQRNAYFIMEDSLNLRDTRIYYTVLGDDGKEKRVLNPKETAIAQQKQEVIGEAFKDWVWKDPQRREELSKVYNETFNSTRPREFDGQHIRFSGITPEITLREHQINAAARILYGGNTLLAHCVGAGKTFTMVAAAMESKRLGLAQKSLFVVPNHLTEQWGGDFLRLYPGANVLVATKKDFEKKNRKKFCARIATGDYDAIVIGHSQFEKIPLSAERQEALIQDEIAEITDAIRDAKEHDGERYTIKQLEKTKKSLETRLKTLADDTRKDSVVTFEELGVDRLFVDEAHSYKNLFLHTKMRNVAGIGQSEAKKSTDMFGKCRYMDELTGGKGVTFATGTPVSNSMVELYTMMRYLQFEGLQAQGLGHFDSWAAAFGEKVTAIELAPEGTGFRSKTRFAKFFNLPELINFWKEATDIQTADMLNLPVPKCEYVTVSTEPSGFQQEMVSSLADRAEDVRNRRVKPNIDNMLKITSDGRKLALDQRLKNELLPDDPESKMNACVDNILHEWEESAPIKGAQLVFCDLSTPHYDGSFNVYDDVKNKLMEKGIPPEEIAFIHDANTDNQKAELFAKVRKGQVRVLLGSTQKMGAGTNVQDLLVALHHTDCPWRPADIEQREGRILRQGNNNDSVKVYKYVTKGTFDAYNWGLVESKQKFIGQIMTSKSPARSAEDIDATALSFAEVKALATGDDRIREKMDLDIQVAKLKLLKANHNTQKYNMEDKILKFYPQKIAETQLYIDAMTADLPMLVAHPVKEDAFAMTVMGTLYTERKEAGEAIIAACKTMTDADQKLNLGEYRGFPMQLSVEGNKFKVSMKQNLTYTAEISADPSGSVTRINNTLEKISENLESHKERLVTLQGELVSAKEEAVRPFSKEDELVEKSTRLTQLNIELDMGNRGENVSESDDEPPVPEGKTSILKALKQFEAPPRNGEREQGYEREAI